MKLLDTISSFLIDSLTRTQTKTTAEAAIIDIIQKVIPGQWRDIKPFNINRVQIRSHSNRGNCHPPGKRQPKAGSNRAVDR